MRPRIRVAALIVQDDSILLVRHEKDEQSYWLLPGGGVDHGETMHEALQRELMEEANVSIDVGELLYVQESIPPDAHRHIVNVYFRAKVTDGTLQCGDDDKRLREVRFMPLSELDEIELRPDIREQLKAAIVGKPMDTYLGNRWKV